MVAAGTHCAIVFASVRPAAALAAGGPPLLIVCRLLSYVRMCSSNVVAKGCKHQNQIETELEVGNVRETNGMVAAQREACC